MMSKEQNWIQERASFGNLERVKVAVDEKCEDDCLDVTDLCCQRRSVTREIRFVWIPRENHLNGKRLRYLHDSQFAMDMNGTP